MSFSWILTNDIDGVEEIADNSGLFTVYDIQGRLIFDKVELEKLSSLSKGIYIVNGVKTIFK